MKTLTMSLVVLSLIISNDILAKDPNQRSERKQSVERKAPKSYSKKDIRVERQRSPQVRRSTDNGHRAKHQARALENKDYRTTGDHRRSIPKGLAKDRRQQPGFGNPRDSIRPEHRGERNNSRPNHRQGQDSNKHSRSPNRAHNRDRREYAGNPSHRNGIRSVKHIRQRLPEKMPVRINSGSKHRHRDDQRVNRHDFRYQQHRWLVDQQRSRRHVNALPNQLNRYRNKHYRGNHRYSSWHRGHNHYHYDYRYRYLYNTNQWYDDYYYHAYFNWRWNQPNYWQLSGYYDSYMDPHYCPDDFATFIGTLAVGALILSW